MIDISKYHFILFKFRAYEWDAWIFVNINISRMDFQGASDKKSKELVKGLSDGDLDYEIYSQLSPVNYLLENKAKEEDSNHSDRVYTTNEILWGDVIDELLYPGRIIRLENFLLSFWFPRSPGLYYTKDAFYSRREAKNFIENDPDEHYSDHGDSTMRIYNPHGKALMLKGGIGCFRFKDKRLDDNDVWLMSASSSFSANQGFPVAVPLDLISKCYGTIQKDGVLPCSLTGRLKFFRGDLSALYKDYIGVPQLYLSVEEILPNRQNKTELKELFKATGAILFESTYEGYPKIYASYVTFFPGEKGSLKDSTEWLHETYVTGMYKGKIITDFDEQTQRFAHAEFSLDKVMDITSDFSEFQGKLTRYLYHSDRQIIMAKQLIQVNKMEGGSINYNEK